MARGECGVRGKKSFFSLVILGTKERESEKNLSWRERIDKVVCQFDLACRTDRTGNNKVIIAARMELHFSLPNHLRERE